jgi:hypothetical protein
MSALPSHLIGAVIHLDLRGVFHLRQLVARLTFTSMPNSSILRDGPKDDPALFNQSLRKFSEGL